MDAAQVVFLSSHESAKDLAARIAGSLADFPSGVKAAQERLASLRAIVEKGDIATVVEELAVSLAPFVEGSAAIQHLEAASKRMEDDLTTSLVSLDSLPPEAWPERSEMLVRGLKTSLLAFRSAIAAEVAKSTAGTELLATELFEELPSDYSSQHELLLQFTGAVGDELARARAQLTGEEITVVVNHRPPPRRSGKGFRRRNARNVLEEQMYNMGAEMPPGWQPFLTDRRARRFRHQGNSRPKVADGPDDTDAPGGVTPE